MSHYAKKFFPLRFATTGSQLVTNGNFDAISLGLIGDGIAATMKKRVKAIGADREKLMTEMNEEQKG